MSGVEVTITGILYDRMNRTQQNVTLIGEAILTGLGVGGGPIHPEPQPPGGKPPGIWPSPGRPEHPWVPPSGGGIPPKPEEPPPDGGDKPPPDTGGWGYVSEWSQWGYFPADDAAQPKR